MPRCVSEARVANDLTGGALIRSWKWPGVAGLIGALALVQLAQVPDARSETLGSLKARMADIQADLDSITARVEDLRTDQETTRRRIAVLDLRIDQLQDDNEQLQQNVIERARALYMGGSSSMLGTLLTAQDFGELSTQIEYASRLSQSNTLLFVRHSRMQAELTAVRDEAERRVEELASVTDSLADEAAQLQDRFRSANDDYKELQQRLAAQARRTRAPSVSTVAPTRPASPPALVHDGMTCPVNGPNSFIDSWGFPRSGGRTHEGTDVMAAAGTPVVAITDGTVTYAGYGSSAGNWIILSGDDGNSYWYMHNQENQVSGGHVSVGQQIATVGNTGNAAGGPTHVHFEYHPGGGDPVNPYPLLTGIC